VEWAATRVRAAWRSLQGPNRYVLKVPATAVQQARRTARKLCGRDTPTNKKNRLGNGHSIGDQGRDYNRAS
jgi:hypothetical protein